MRKFTTGMIAGGIMGAMGILMAASDKSTRKRLIKGSKRVMNDVTDKMDDVKSKMW